LVTVTFEISYDLSLVWSTVCEEWRVIKAIMVELVITKECR
jgi:hypothetical protein